MTIKEFLFGKDEPIECLYGPVYPEDEDEMMDPDILYFRPLNQSYQVGPNLYAGEYPGDKNGQTATEKLEQMHAFGVRVFVDLTEEGELIPYANQLSKDTKYRRFSIPDVSVPASIEDAQKIVNYIRYYADGNHGDVYVHCWGGVGRTGTIIACYLAEQMEDPELETVLSELRDCFAQMPKSAHRVTPETKEQEFFIRRYIADVKERHALPLRVKDCIRGSLMAGAAGDALGYAVEFMRLDRIRSRYGMEGITQFELDSNGKALVSDDTQMTLFTANGLLVGYTRWRTKGIGAELSDYVPAAYVDWFYTQTEGLHPVTHHDSHDYPYTWLRYLPEMAHRRAPGNTCMDACEKLMHLHEPENNSKGCGGIMRVAPLGLFEASIEARKGIVIYEPDQLAVQGAKIARATHLHPLGYLPASLLTLLLARLIPITPDETRKRIIPIAKEVLGTVMCMDEPMQAKEELRQITLKAIRLAQSVLSDEEAIKQLGEGWTGDQSWAIALFCTIRHIDSMRDAIVAAVNHDGDSDSTGSITGNIMGAIYGYEAIKQERLFCPEGKEFEPTIELADIILALADDLSADCTLSEEVYYREETPAERQWEDRYLHGKPAGLKRT